LPDAPEISVLARLGLRGGPMQSGGTASPVVVQAASGSAVAQAPLPVPHASRHWQLNESLVYLNHAQYGATPVRVLRAQAELRERMERDPTRFLKVDLEPLMDGVREKLGGLLGCSPADLGLMRNATYALCTILRNTPFKTGDEILVTDQEYPSLHNELERMQATQGVKVVKATIPFPIRSGQVVLDRLLALVTPRTKMVIVSHITSASAMIYPVASIVREMQERGIDVVVDGAHSPGQIHVDVGAIRPAYFVGSGHKWLSGPKGIGFFYCRPDRQHLFRPLALSGRAHKVRPNRSLFLRDYDYQGTDDYSALLSLPTAIDTMQSLLPGGWSALLRHNHELAMAGREIVANALGVEPPCPTGMLGSMVTLPLPEAPPHLRNRPTCYDDALQDALLERHRIVVPIWRLNAGDGALGQRVVRFSAQLYNTLEQYELLGRAMKIELAREV
jgi:isopenicillin-N epimerase